MTDRSPNTAEIQIMVCSIPELHLQDTRRDVSQSHRRRRYSPTPTHTTIPSVPPQME